jgi:diguanylate cyclase (GGDEF)-like protein
MDTTYAEGGGPTQATGAIGPVRFLVTMMIVVFSVEALIMIGFSLFPPLPPVLETAIDAGVLTLVSGAVLWFALGVPFRRALERQHSSVQAGRTLLLEQAASREIDAQIMRGLEMAETEAEIIDVARHTLDIAVSGHAAEIRLADSSHAHLRLVAESPEDGGPGCSVETPASCPAVRRGHPLTFASSHVIDACPRLRDRASGDVSAVCVPISLLGRAAGVLHVTGAPDVPPTQETVERLRLLGAGVGSRLGMVRSLNDSALQASTDPLTGLLNRRALEAAVAPLERGSKRYAVIALDLDHFKALNDTHGHVTGDQALRLFARVLRSSLREDDLVARIGGEEFLAVLPNTSSTAAVTLAERIRLELIDALSGGTVPGFTVSAGITDTTEGLTFEEVAHLADTRLYTAKTNGRDRIEVGTVRPE